MTAVAPPRPPRSLAPDLARGFMLAFIALANAPLYLWGRATDHHGVIADASPLDSLTLAIDNLVIAERSRPMFAILYGFGLAMMTSRLTAAAHAAGASADAAQARARGVVRRRSLWLMAFGVAHAALLFMGDILASYGVAGLIALAFVTRPDRVVRRWFAWSLVGVVLVSAPLVAFVDADWGDGTDALSPPNGATYVESVATGIADDVLQMLASGLLMLYVPLIAGGVLLLRSGWLTDPAAHLPQLRLVWRAGMAVGVASALPITGLQAGWWEAGLGWSVAATWLTLVGGMAAGLGYVCGFALLAHRLAARGRRGVPRALAALGERSLTGYLTQSIIMAPVLSAWGLGLGEGMGYAAAFGVGAAAWLTSVGVALALDAAGRRGPFEAALRRLAYGRVGRPTADAAARRVPAAG